MAWLALSLTLLPMAFARAQEPSEHPDAPSAFSTVIDARDYDERFESVEDVLSQVAGVRVRRFGGLGSYSTASIRGSKAEQVLVLLDGVRLNSAHRGGVDLSTLSLRGIDRIDVIRGAGAARYGSDAVGGVISITSRTRGAEDAVDVSARAGSLKTLGADLYLSSGGDRGQTTLGYSRLRSENDFRFDLVPQHVLPFALPSSRHTRLNADFAQDTVLVNGSLALANGTELAMSANLFDKRNGQPGSTSGVPFGSPDDKVSCTGPEESFRRASGGLVWRDPSFGEGALELQLSHRYERSKLDDENHCFFSKFLPIDDDVQTTEHASHGELRWAGRPRRWGSLSWLPRASLGARYEQVRATDSESKRRIWVSSFVQQDLRLFGGALRLLPALGFETADTSGGATRVSASTNPVEVAIDERPRWLPRIGAILRLAPGLRLKANYLRAYRRPSFRELFHPDYGFVRGNPFLEPEDGWNFDVGLELWREALGPISELRMQAVWFDRRIEQSIEWQQVGTTFLPVNTGEASAHGWELQGSFSLLERLQVASSYTFVDSEIRATGVPLPQTPRNRFQLRAELLAGAARLWGEWSYEDEVPLQASQTPFAAPEVRQLDAGVILRLAQLPGLHWVGDGVTVSAEWVNLLAEARVDSLGLPLPDDTLFFVVVRGAFE